MEPVRDDNSEGKHLDLRTLSPEELIEFDAIFTKDEYRIRLQEEKESLVEQQTFLHSLKEVLSKYVKSGDTNLSLESTISKASEIFRFKLRILKMADSRSERIPILHLQGALKQIDNFITIHGYEAFPSLKELDEMTTREFNEVTRRLISIRVEILNAK